MPPVLSMEIRANAVLECRGNWFRTRLSTILESSTFKEPTVGLTPIILPSPLRFHPIMTFLGFQPVPKLLHYLTNYATEADVSPQQMLVKARLLAETRQNLACAINDTDHKVISETPQKVVKIGNFCYVFIIYHFFFPHGLL